MLVRFFGRLPSEEIIPIHLSLQILDQLVQQFEEKGLLHRNFAAIVIAKSQDPSGHSAHKESWDDFLRDIQCVAWVGDGNAITGAERDYLSNAKAKAFTSWRHNADNVIVLDKAKTDGVASPFHLVPEDSLWPGAVYGKKYVTGVSGLMPEQDIWLARTNDMIISHLPGNFEREALKYLYPPQGTDTLEGANFDIAPDFSIFAPHPPR